MRFLTALLLAILLSGTALAGEPITGVASVIDGDTIEIHARRIRLAGIDAAESRQLCRKANRPYRCGQEAAFALANKIERQTVTCEGQDVDRYGRTVAICLAGGVDLGQWMVAQGQALAYIEYVTPKFMLPLR